MSFTKKHAHFKIVLMKEELARKKQQVKQLKKSIKIIEHLYKLKPGRHT